MAGESARVWDAQTGQPLIEPLKHTGAVNSAQFSPDGQRIVTAANDCTALVWDTQTGQPLTEPLKHTGMVSSAQFSPDGQRVVTAANDRTALVWDVAPAPACYPGWLLEFATAVCGEVLSVRGALEFTNQVHAFDRLRQTPSGQQGSQDWLVLGRWLLAAPLARTISPFSKLTVAEWIDRRFNNATVASLDELERLAISLGDAGLLERVSQARLP